MRSPARTGKGRRLLFVAFSVLLAFSVWFALNADRMLVVDEPQASDLIVVLAGETDLRPAYGVELLAKGYAPRMLINVPASAKVYGFTEPELAKQYIQKFSQSASIGICPILGLSTRDESHDVAQCLAHENVARVLIVTSDYHTRRSLSIFRREIPGKTFSIAAVRDSTQFGPQWWRHRQWAKTCVDEWMRLAWWSVVERWR